MPESAFSAMLWSHHFNTVTWVSLACNSYLTSRGKRSQCSSWKGCSNILSIWSFPQPWKVRARQEIGPLHIAHRLPVMPTCAKTLLFCVQMLINLRCAQVHNQNIVVAHIAWLLGSKAKISLKDRTFYRNGNWGTEKTVIFLGLLFYGIGSIMDFSVLEFGISTVVSESKM